MTDSGRSLERLQRKILGDGPAERQILLLKLCHEFESSPSAGDKYNGDASTPVQQWIARVGAILARVSVQRGIEFKSIKATSVQYWTFSYDNLRRTMLETIEELKLELELDGRDEIGQVYDAEKQYDFFTDLKGIVSSAEREVFIVDAYFDAATFHAYLSTVDPCISIRILCSRYANDLAACVQTFTAQTKGSVEVRKSQDTHDRVLFVDQSDCWIVGASIKDAGRKPTYLIPLQPQLAKAKQPIYENIWLQSKIP